MPSRRIGEAMSKFCHFQTFRAAAENDRFRALNGRLNAPSSRCASRFIDFSGMCFT